MPIGWRSSNRRISSSVHEWNLLVSSALTLMPSAGLSLRNLLIDCESEQDAKNAQ